MDPAGPQLLTRLLDQHGAALVLYARQWSNAPEDIVQEAFLRLMRERPVPENVVGWLYRVVRNLAVSASRSQARRARHETAAAAGGQRWFIPADGQRIDADAATEALKELPGDLRETIILRLWGGLAFREVAQLTRTSTSTAHRRYETGLATLRERLGEACPEKDSHTK